MSQWRRRGKVDPDKEFEARDARIVTITMVKNPILRALVKQVHEDYCHFNCPVMGYQEALAKWRRDPSSVDKADTGDNAADNDLGGFFEEEAPDVESYINEVMMHESQQFNADHHDWYKRHLMSLHIAATCVVEYEGGRETATVTGVWCTLSKHVPLIIKGSVINTDHSLGSGNGMHYVDAAKRSDVHGIEVGPIPWVRGSQFAALLREQQMEEDKITNYIQRFFATPSEDLPDEDESEQNDHESDGGAHRAPVIVSVQRHASMIRRQGQLDSGVLGSASRVAAVARARGLAMSSYGKNRVTLADLWVRFKAARLDERNLVETETVALGTRLVVYARELWEIKDMYGDREIAITAAARGPNYTIVLDRILTEQPEVLCFPKLRKAKADEVHLSALALLPDLSFESYIKLARRSTREFNPIIACAVDVYHHILRYDVYGDGKPPTERSFSAGNLFSVFGMADEERYADYYHGGSSGMRAAVPDTAEQLYDANSLSAVGRFAMPADPQAMATLEQRQMLQIDIGRLKQRTATEQLIRALAWLRDQHIVVIESFVGSGKHNKGRTVDAFYMAEIYELQQKCVAKLTDIYERSIKQSMHHSPLERSKPDMIALFEQVQGFVEQWRELYLPAVFDAAQMKKHAALVATATPADRPLARQQSGEEPEPQAQQVSPIAKLARQVARNERMFMKKYDEICATLGFDDKADAYADARQGRWIYRMPLLLKQLPDFTLANGRPLAAEQIEGIKRMRIEPISQLSGCGGVGKSETLAFVVKQYPPEQILCVAFTGQVASNLSMRTGLHASTIHSVLFQHTRYMEARHRSASYRKHALAKSNRSPVDQGENYTYEQVNTTNDDSELRAYIDSRLSAVPPFASPCKGKRVFIIDEISLPSLPYIVRLLEAMHNPAEGDYIERFIVCGDLDQLPAIGFGNIQSDIAHGIPQATIQLTKNHRSRGTELFDLARALAQHRYDLPMPDFEFAQSMANLRKPIAEMPPIVTLDTNVASIADNIEMVLKAIGAIDNPEWRREVQIIATTNIEVEKANAAVRWLYFGKPELEKSRGTVGAVQIIRRQPAAAAAPQDADDDAGPYAAAAIAGTPAADDDAPPYGNEALGVAASAPDVEERQAIEKAMSMQIRVGDRFYLKKNTTEVFKPTKHDSSVRKKRYFNTRLLEVVQFYDAPRSTHVKCRCKLCPPPPGDVPEGFVHPCMMRLDLVPQLRQRVIQPNEPGYISHHDLHMPRPRDNERRIAVCRDDNGTFIEIDVARLLVPRSRWEFGWALTTHKMQGAQQKYVLYICTEPRSYVTWKHAYTGGTRAQHVLFLLSNAAAFDRTARHKEPVRRSMLWLHLQRGIVAVLRRYPGSVVARSVQHTCPTYIDAQTSAEIWEIFEQQRLNAGRMIAMPEPLFAAAQAPVVRDSSSSSEADDDEDFDDPSAPLDEDASEPSYESTDDDAEYDEVQLDDEPPLDDDISLEFDIEGDLVAVKRRKIK